MLSLEAGALTGLLGVFVVAAGAAGWALRRKQERSRRRAYEAAYGEQINAAGRARDRAREEALEVEERWQRLRDEHAGCSDRLADLEAALAQARSEIATIVADSRARDERLARIEKGAGLKAELKTRPEVQEVVRVDAAPSWLLPAPQGRKDDLKVIRGLGPVLEQHLNRLGIFHFHQLARMTAKDAHWIAGRITAFPGLNKRYRWAEQAKGMQSPRGHGGNGGNGGSRRGAPNGRVAEKPD